MNAFVHTHYATCLLGAIVFGLALGFGLVAWIARR